MKESSFRTVVLGTVVRMTISGERVVGSEEVWEELKKERRRESRAEVAIELSRLGKIGGLERVGRGKYRGC